MANDEVFKLYASVDVDVRKAVSNLKKIENAAEDSADAIKELGSTPASVKKQARAILSAEKKLLNVRKRTRAKEDKDIEASRKAADAARIAADKQADAKILANKEKALKDLNDKLDADAKKRRERNEAADNKMRVARNKQDRDFASKYAKEDKARAEARAKQDAKLLADRKAADTLGVVTKRDLARRRGEDRKLASSRKAEDESISKLRKAEQAPVLKTRKDEDARVETRRKKEARAVAAAAKKAATKIETRFANANKKLQAKRDKVVKSEAAARNREDSLRRTKRAKEDKALAELNKKAATQTVNDAQRARNNELKERLQAKRARTAADLQREKLLSMQEIASIAPKKLAKNRVKQAKRDEAISKARWTAHVNEQKSAELTARATKKRILASRNESPEQQSLRAAAAAAELEANARKKVAQRLRREETRLTRQEMRDNKGQITDRTAQLKRIRDSRRAPNQYRSPIGPQLETPQQFARRMGGSIALETKATAQEMSANKAFIQRRSGELRNKRIASGWDKKQFSHRYKAKTGAMSEADMGPFDIWSERDRQQQAVWKDQDRASRDRKHNRREERMPGLAKGLIKGLGFGAAFSGIQLAGEALGASLRMLWDGFIQGAGKAIQLTVEFEKALRELNGLTKLSEQDLAALGDRLRTVGDRLKIGVDPTKAAESLRGLFAAGFTDLPTAEKVLDQSLKLSKAGFVDQTKAADLLGSTMIAYGASADEAARYSDALIASTDLGLVTMEQLSQSMGRVTPSAVQAGVSIEEMSAVIGASTATGLRAESSIAGFAQAFKKLTNPTKAGKEAMAEYGIVVDENTIKQKGLVNTLIEIDKILGGSAAKWQQVLGGNTQGRTSVLSLFDAKDGEDRYARLLTAVDTVNNSMGTTAQRLESVMKSAHEQFLLFQSNVKAAAISITQTLEPAIAKFFKLLNHDLKPALDDITASLGAMVESVLQALGIENKGGLEGTLNAINSAIQGSTEFLIDLIGWTKKTYNFLKLLGNLFTWYAGMLYNLLAVIKAYMTDGKAAAMKAWEEFQKDFMQDTQDMSDALNGLFMEDKDWEKALNNREAILEKHKNKVKDQAQDIQEALNTEAQQKKVEADAKKIVQSASPALKTELEKTAKEKDLTPQETARLAQTYPLSTSTNPNTGRQDLARDIRKPLSDDFISMGQKPLRVPGDFDAVGQLIADPIDMSLAKKLSKDSASKPSSSSTSGSVDIEERQDAIEKLIALEKISKHEALEKYKWLLRVAKAQGADGEVRFKLEKEIHDLSKDIAEYEKDRLDKAKEAAETLRKAQQEMHLDTLKATKGEFAAKRQALEYEKQERLKIAGITKKEVDDWFTAGMQDIQTEEDADKKEKSEKKIKESNEKESERLKLQADIAGAPGGLSAEYRQKLLELDAEEAKFKDVEENKTLMTEMFAAKRAALEKQYLREVEDARQAILANTVANEAVVLEAKGQATQAAKIQNELAANQRYTEIQRTVDEARKAGVSEIDIRRYVLSEQNRIFAEAKQKEKQIEEGIKAPVKSVSGQKADPRYTQQAADEAAEQNGETSSGFSVGSFSIAAGGGRKIKRSEHQYNPMLETAYKLSRKKSGATSKLDPASKILAAGVGAAKNAMNNQVGEGKTEKNILEITITGPDGNKQKVLATPDKAAEYKTGLGRF